MRNILSPQAIKLIDAYKHLDVGLTTAVPYFNNKRTKIRGGLSVLVGKGSPEEIATEARIIAKRQRVLLPNLTVDELKKFLVEQGLGVDCSGFAYHILNAEAQARGKGKLSNAIKTHTSFLRKILHRLRPEMNTNVEVIAKPANSHEITLEEAGAGDVIVMLKTGPKKTYNHIMVIREVMVDAIGTKTIFYVHSYAWPVDGKYNHGVRDGFIRIANPILPITEAKWTENGLSDKENPTFQNALEAEETSVRRLALFTENA